MLRCTSVQINDMWNNYLEAKLDFAVLDILTRSNASFSFSWLSQSFSSNHPAFLIVWKNIHIWAIQKQLRPGESSLHLRLALVL